MQNMQDMQLFTDKEILGDGLAAQKSTTEHFNTFAGECVHENVRNVMLEILEQEHSIQKEVFDMMHQRGFYQTPAAEAKKVTEAQQKFSKSVKYFSRKTLTADLQKYLWSGFLFNTIQSKSHSKESVLRRSLRTHKDDKKCPREYPDD